MSDSDSDDSEQAFCFFGTPLDPLDKDEIPRKKPISVEEQIATDSHGRRRFHGAFTGGFSAGFFNTVGSLEGWRPNDFKSSRTEKAQIMVQKPEDFMDDEDVGEFGIAPKTVKATQDYSTAKKRKRMLASGPIPGEPVLNTFISSGNETIGYLLLKNIGIQDKIAKKDVELGFAKVYGCEMPSTCKISSDVEKKLYNMPTMYVECLANPKSNTFGIGYKGLDRSCHNMLSSTSLLVKEGNNKNIHIVGQAFGVGAFEEYDDDIYSKEDLSNYDFELTQEKTKATSSSYNRDLIFSIFKKSNVPLLCKKQFPVIIIPPGFSGKHKKRISRFEPIKENPDIKSKPKINPSVRAKYLGEGDENTSNSPLAVAETKTNNNVSIKEDKDKIHSLLSLDRFVSASHKEETNNVLESVQKKTITCYASEQMQDAVKMKMFGPLTRTTSDWHPHHHLCERFNVPEPLMDKPQINQRKRRNLIFEQQICFEESSILKPGLSEESVKSEHETDRDPSDLITSNQTDISPEIDIVEEDRKINESDKRIVPQSETFKDTFSQHQTIKDSVFQSADVKANDSEVGSNGTDVASKDITEKINIAGKADLFRAVFLSSDESEEEIEHEEVSAKDGRDLFKTIVLEPLIPIVKNAKQGILSNLSFSNLSGESSTNVERAKDEGTVTNEANTIKLVPLYGPCLPAQKCRGNVESISKNKEANIQKISSDSSDEWVEKGDTTHKKNKKNKKKKAKDRKHKKHKKHSS
nr:unnamed protein product [Callosobruchus chinensis]